MYNITMGLNKDDLAMVNGVLMRVDTSYLKTGKGDYDRIQSAFASILKSMRFLGFFDDSQKLKVVKNKEGKNSSCLDAFGEIMAQKLKHTEIDRDLVVMRHNFTMEDNKTKERWLHTSTMIVSGDSHASGGSSIMSRSVGQTTALGVRLVLEGKVPQRGIVSPIHKEIYEPILKSLEGLGMMMVEESEKPGGTTASNPTRAKL